MSSGEMNQLKVLAHQLKGAAGGYGFAAISNVSASLESAVIAGADKSTIAGHVASLARPLQSNPQRRRLIAFPLASRCRLGQS